MNQKNIGIKVIEMKKLETVDWPMKHGKIKRVTYRIEEKGLMKGMRTPIGIKIIQKRRK